LALELQPFGVQVKLVLPGRSPTTRFAENARPRMEGAIPEAYADLAARVFENFQDNTQVTHAQDVAEAVWQAATDPAAPLRMPAGEDAKAWAAAA
jgi:NAD(P)-dependent dehydrogenase (short-subunit alcohol dehydrogenase family)